MTASPKLEQPPVNEVVCGFVFEPTTLSALDIGVYWEQRREDFPRHELHPPVLDNISLDPKAILNIRAWLVSEDDELLVQIQNDRFYMNWRRRGDRYPRFADHEGRPGLKRRAIEEFKEFSGFVASRSGSPVRLRRLELTKIDILEKGHAYTHMADLQDLLPVTKVFEQVALADPQQLQLRFSEAVEEGKATNVAVIMDTRRVKIETRHTFPHKGEFDDEFHQANERVNRVFFGLVDTRRFRKDSI